MKGKDKLKILIVGVVLVMVACFALYQPFIDYLITQASNPEGAVGSVITRIWSDYFQDLSKWGFTHVDIDEHHTILDVGFGGGANIKYITEHSTDTKYTVYGIDVSGEAVKTATEVNQEYVDSGEVMLTLGDVAELQFEDAFFDLVVASQTHIYWEELNTGLSECYRVLKPDGILLITSEIDKIEYHLSEYKNPDDFVFLLNGIGYSEVNVKVSGNYVAFICTK